jgi:ADP-heptose:LPS heptosyltransferase
LPDRILIVRAGALGDTLMATPTIRALKQRYPDAELDFLCSEAARPLLEENPAIARLFSLAQRNVPYFFSLEKRRLARAMRERAYGIAVLLESGHHYRELIEHAGAREIRDIRVTHDPHVHAIVNNLRAAGCDVAKGQDPPPMEIHLAPRDEMRAAEMLGGLPRPWIGLHAGYGPPRRKDSRQQGERLKAWGAENFARLGKMLRECHGASIVLTGGGSDLPVVSRIAELLGPPEPLVLAGRTSVREMAAVIEQLDVLVSVDSGPAHMAAALGTRLVVLWGPAILEQVRPWGDPERVVVVRHPVFCAPCYGTPMMKQCDRNICMEAISPARVAGEVARLIG